MAKEEEEMEELLASAGVALHPVEAEESPELVEQRRRLSDLAKRRRDLEEQVSAMNNPMLKVTLTTTPFPKAATCSRIAGSAGGRVGPVERRGSRAHAGGSLPFPPSLPFPSLYTHPFSFPHSLAHPS